MLAYATSAEYLTWTGLSSAPADIDRLLLRASELLDVTVLVSYGIDTNGLPTDTDIAAAMRDACCSQVEFWQEVGESNSIDGLAGAQISVGGYSGPRAPDLAPRALNVLQMCVAGNLMALPQ